MPGRRVFVQSRELRWIQFDDQSSKLKVEFLAGGIYEYQRVPKSKYKALLAAESKGRYFNAHIRGHYLYTHIS
jgi:hypothetical protein